MFHHHDPLVLHGRCNTDLIYNNLVTECLHIWKRNHKVVGDSRSWKHTYEINSHLLFLLFYLRKKGLLKKTNCESLISFQSPLSTLQLFLQMYLYYWNILPDCVSWLDWTPGWVLHTELCEKLSFILQVPFAQAAVCLLMKSQTSPLLARKVYFPLMLFSCTRWLAPSSEYLNKPGRSLGEKTPFSPPSHLSKHLNCNLFHLPSPRQSQRCFDPRTSTTPHWGLVSMLA